MPVSEEYVNLLKRVREMCRTGQTAGAELELNAVYRQAGCPACVKVVLAALLARRGGHKDARHILKDIHTRHFTENSQAQMRLAITIMVSLGLPHDAETLGKAYHKTYGRAAADWLRTMSVPGCTALGGHTRRGIDELAEDLSREPKAIQTLVYAQKLRRDLPTVQLLRQAIRRIVPLFEDDTRQMATVCAAMAELGILAGDHTQARRWAHRGLEEDPYNATLALLIDQLRDDGRTALPPRAVLLCAATHHPDYPDLQAALIKRETAEGMLDQARERLDDWIEREPNSPHALALRKEIAA